MSDLMLWLSDLSEFWIAAVGAAVGAIIGAIVSSVFAYRIQSRVFDNEKKVREDELRRIQQVLGRSLIIKLGKIHSNISWVHQFLEKSFQMQEQNPDGPMEPWGFVREFAPLPVPVRFASDELSMLMSLGGDNVFSMVLNMEPVHDSILDLVKEYHSKRRELFDNLPVSSVRGVIASTHLDSELITASLQIQMNSVNSFIKQLRAHAERGSRESGQTLTDLCKLLNDKLDLRHRVEFPESDEKTTANNDP